MAIEIVDLPMENGGSFHRLLYVYQRVKQNTSASSAKSNPPGNRTKRRRNDAAMERMVQFLFADAAMMFVVDVLLLGVWVKPRWATRNCKELGFTVRHFPTGVSVDIY